MGRVPIQGSFFFQGFSRSAVMIFKVFQGPRVVFKVFFKVFFRKLIHIISFLKVPFRVKLIYYRGTLYFISFIGTFP